MSIRRFVKRACVTGALSLITATGFAQTETSEGEAIDQSPLSAEAEAAAKELAATYAPDTEAGAMLETILSGRGMSATEGWFRIAVPQTRYDWERISSRFDADGDGAIVPAEFPGTVEEFRALDRDRDRHLSPADIAWEAERGTPEFRRLANQIDRDGDGRLTREELTRWAERATTDSPELSIEEFRRLVEPPDNRKAQKAEQPRRSMLVMGLARQEIGSLQPGPQLGESAPDFELNTVDGSPIRLSDRIGERPMVLIFGNYTCGPFRAQAGNLQRLHERYGDRADFLMVYVREAHPEDGWASGNNRRAGVQVLQPQQYEERLTIARTCSAHLNFDVPVLVDSLEDHVGRSYSGGPARLYLIDREGKIAFKGGRGPHYFLPSQLESALVWMLAEEQADRTE